LILSLGEGIGQCGKIGAGDGNGVWSDGSSLGCRSSHIDGICNGRLDIGRAEGTGAGAVAFITKISKA
jgi:hypothetical protein